MRKNGFTLIELLAVIVILAIIALIATPIILGIINDAREKANERSVELYASAVRNGFAAYQLREGKEVKAGTYNKDNKLPFDVEYDGKVDCTNVIISEDGKVSLDKCTVNGGTKEYSYGIEEEKTVKLNDVCTIASDSIVEGLNMGAKYNCKVDPNKPVYTFYVLNTPEEDATSVNLIMDSNIRTGGEAVKEATPTIEQKGTIAWVTKEDYISKEIGGIESDYSEEYGNNTKGPITAMNYLQEATVGWTNVNKQTISFFTDHDGNTHPMGKTYTVNARMPYINEVVTTGCDLINYEVGTCPFWMVDYLRNFEDNYPDRTEVSGLDGYWTLSSYTSSFALAFAVFYPGFNYYDDNVTAANSYGVRPVINLSI